MGLIVMTYDEIIKIEKDNVGKKPRLSPTKTYPSVSAESSG